MTMSVIGSGGMKEKAVGLAGDERPAMGRVVRAVMMKELRQNWLNLALVICLEFIIVCVAEWFRSGWLFDTMHEYSNVLLFPAVHESIALGCAAAGLLLGVLQPLADRNFDLWSFLTHRPAPRWWLYLGRVIAGMLLYGIAAGLPVAFALAIAPTRWGGRFFIWEYMLPPIADWMSGLAFYFVGLLIMERHARWHGSRVVPLVIAVGGAMVAANVTAFSTAEAISIGLIVLLIAASMGSSVTHGYSLRMPLWARMAIFVVMFSSFTCIFTIPAKTGLASTAEQDGRIRFHWGEMDDYSDSGYWTERQRFTIRQCMFLPDATLAIWERTQVPTRVNNKTTFVEIKSSLTDLKGNALSLKRLDGWDDIAYRSSVFELPREDVNSTYRDVGERVLEEDGKLDDPSGQTGTEEARYWVQDRGIFYFYRQPVYHESFFQETPPIEVPHRVFLGTLGVNGFVEPGKLAEPFESPFLSREIMQTPHAMYRISTEARTVKVLFTVPQDETIYAMCGEYERLRKNGNVTWIEAPAAEQNRLVFTSRHIFWISPEDKIIFQVALPRDPMTSRVIVRSVPTAHKWMVEYFPKSGYMGIFTPMPVTYCFYDEQGKLLETQDIANFYDYSEDPKSVLTEKGIHALNRAEFKGGLLTATGSPILTTATAALWAGRYYRWDVDAVAQVWRQQWRFWAGMLTILGLCAIALWLLSLWYARPAAARWGWTILALLFGPAAILTFLALHRLPCWARCSACRGIRLRRDQHCAKCGASWPAPAVTGTEIFTGVNIDC